MSAFAQSVSPDSNARSTEITAVRIHAEILHPVSTRKRITTVTVPNNGKGKTAPSQQLTIHNLASWMKNLAVVAKVRLVEAEANALAEGVFAMLVTPGCIATRISTTAEEVLA